MPPTDHQRYHEWYRYMFIKAGPSQPAGSAFFMVIYDHWWFTNDIVNGIADPWEYASFHEEYASFHEEWPSFDVKSASLQLIYAPLQVINGSLAVE